MKSIVNVKIWFCLALLCLTVGVHCGCEDKSEEGISGFFSDLGCSIKHGAVKVKEGVQDGYKYIKEKVSSDSDEHQTQGQVQTIGNQQLEGESDIYKQIRESVPIESTSSPISFDVRNSVSGLTCPPNSLLNVATGICEPSTYN